MPGLFGRTSTISSLWLPTNIGGCKRWGRGDTYVKDGVDRVSQGTDKSGNGNHFTQTTDAAKPVWYPAYFNGQDAFKFDGLDDTLVKTGGIVIPQPLTIFLVFVNFNLSFTSGHTFFRNSPLSLLADTLFIIGGASPRFYAGSASIQSDTVDFFNNGNYIVEYQYDGANSKALVNNVQKVSGNPGAGGFDTSDLYLGSYGSGGFMSLYLLEDLIYDSILSSGNRTLLYSYFNTRYGL